MCHGDMQLGDQLGGGQARLLENCFTLRHTRVAKPWSTGSICRQHMLVLHHNISMDTVSCVRHPSVGVGLHLLARGQASRRSRKARPLPCFTSRRIRSIIWRRLGPGLHLWRAVSSNAVRCRAAAFCFCSAARLCIVACLAAAAAAIVVATAVGSASVTASWRQRVRLAGVRSRNEVAALHLRGIQPQLCCDVLHHLRLTAGVERGGRSQVDEMHACRHALQHSGASILSLCRQGTPPHRRVAMDWRPGPSDMGLCLQHLTCSMTMTAWM